MKTITPNRAEEIERLTNGAIKFNRDNNGELQSVTLDTPAGKFELAPHASFQSLVVKEPYDERSYMLSFVAAIGEQAVPVNIGFGSLEELEQYIETKLPKLPRDQIGIHVQYNNIEENQNEVPH